MTTEFTDPQSTITPARKAGDILGPNGLPVSDGGGGSSDVSEGLDKDDPFDKAATPIIEAMIQQGE